MPISLLMNYGEYYLNTLISAAKNLGPTVLILIVGYFVFFKLSYIQVKNKEKTADPTQPEVSPDEEIKPEQQARAKEEPRKEKAKEKVAPKRPMPSREEMLFKYAAGESFSQKDLKRRYHRLLKEHHPDKVASLDERRKLMAEKKTKEINSAYEQLKKKAS